MTIPDPNWKPVAFKEWHLVQDALIAGEQSVILRKGGISEGKEGFQWLYDRFFLFPGRFHEQASRLKPNPDGSLRDFPTPLAPEGKVAFSVFVETQRTGRLTEWEEVKKLDPYHIWNETIIRERFEWGDEPGISFAIVKVFLLQDPWILDDRKGFGGCRSWFGLPTDEGGGWQKHLESAVEVGSACGYPEWLMTC